MLKKVLPALVLVVVAAFAHAEKISGFVKGSPSGKTFMVGSKKGTYTVDASKATIRLDGKFFALAKLTGGSQVTVEGDVKGMNVAAKNVNIGHLAGSKKDDKKPEAKPGNKPAAAPGKGGNKPAAKPGNKPAAKPGNKPAAKPGAHSTKPMAKPTATKPGAAKADAGHKTDAKAKGKTDAKAKGKTDSKSKAKSKDEKATH